MAAHGSLHDGPPAPCRKIFLVGIAVTPLLFFLKGLNFISPLLNYLDLHEESILKA